MAIFTIDHPLQFAFGVLGNVVSFMVYLAPLDHLYLHVHSICTKEGQNSNSQITSLAESWSLLYDRSSYSPVSKRPKPRCSSGMDLCCIRGKCLCSTLKHCEAGNKHKECGVYAILAIIIPDLKRNFMVFLRFIIEGHLYCCFFFGVLQMILYAIYKDTKKTIDEKKVPEQKFDVDNLSTTDNSEEHIIDVQPECEENIDIAQEDLKDMIEQIGKMNKKCMEYPVMPISYGNIACVEVV
ncbi:hypothetical protein IFM89_014339 [Coptis chinensis]|uniref:Uncharacterized protein n=1 Tax=Coptis chinensis TaxID=261450 RepID=A0A835HUX6_9MAGN|nr:hypothetical protein IFM89_014339 [Coptis chinensis]